MPLTLLWEALSYTAHVCDIFVSILENLWTVFAMNYIHHTFSEGDMTLSGLLIYSKVNKQGSIM